MESESLESTPEKTIRNARTSKRVRKICTFSAIFSSAVLAIVLSTGTRAAGLLLALAIYWVLALGELRKCSFRDPIELWDRFGLGQDEEYDAPQLSEKEQRLQEELRRESRRLSACYRVSLIVFLTTIIGIFSGVGGALLLNQGGMLIITVVSIVAGLSLLGSLQIRGDHAAREAESRITKIGVEGLGAVVDFLQSSDDRLHAPAIGAITRVLRSIRASDGAHISPVHRRYLYGMLAPWRAKSQPSLALAVLHMAEQFADPLAQPFLQDLLAMENPSTDQQRELVSGAYRALQSIGQADAELGRRGTLVSPATAPDALGNALLRSGSPSEHAPERLLRSPSSPDAP